MRLEDERKADDADHQQHHGADQPSPRARARLRTASLASLTAAGADVWSLRLKIESKPMRCRSGK